MLDRSWNDCLRQRELLKIPLLDKIVGGQHTEQMQVNHDTQDPVKINNGKT